MASLIRTAALGAVAAAMLATQAQAISRVNTTDKSCQTIQNRVAREGAVILRYPARNTPGLTLYDRYVRNVNFCVLGQITERDYIPSADTKNCRVLKCVQPDYDDDFIFKRRN